jgi:hypothetical protein
MSANALLLWMSARRQGSWQQFRAAVEELHINDSAVTSADDDTPDQFALPLYQSLRLDFQRLGHAEFFAGVDGADWRVTPPSLAVTRSTDEWLGVLAGARSPKLLHRLTAAASGRLQNICSPGCPDQILIGADSEDVLAAVARQAGLLLQLNAPATLLTCLPPIDDSSVRHECPMPFGADWKIERFSAENLRWRSATRDDAVSASGDLFRFSLQHQRYLLFCLRGIAFRVPGQVGKFLVLRRRRRNIIRYDVSSMRLSVPASCRPPFLVERALILCSGSLPSYRTNSGIGTIEYAQISESVARTTAAILRQELS